MVTKASVNTLRFNIAIENKGASTANRVKMVLSTQDSYATLELNTSIISTSLAIISIFL